MASPEVGRPAEKAGAVRGACTACGAFHSLDADSTVRVHVDLASRSRCPGSGRKPVATTESGA